MKGTLCFVDGIQTCDSGRHNLQLVDAAQYYLDNVERFNQDNFQPNHEVNIKLLQ